MYFHLVYSAEIFAVTSGRKSTRKLFRQATNLMGLIDHDFVGNSTSSLFAFPLMPLSSGHIAPLGETSCSGALRHTWVRKTQVELVRKH